MINTSINKSPGTSTSLLKRKCKVYDVDRKELIGEFESMKEAAEFLGIRVGHVSMAIKDKFVNKTNKLGLRIAIR